MKKQIFALLAVFIAGTTHCYNFYVVNNSDIPITVALYVKGVVWPWDKVFLVKPSEYASFSTLAYCGKEVVINDARQTIIAGDTILDQATFEIPWSTSCHMHQIITVNAPLLNPDQTEQYYTTFGKKHAPFRITYTADLNGKTADGIKVSKTLATGDVK